MCTYSCKHSKIFYFIYLFSLRVGVLRGSTTLVRRTCWENPLRKRWSLGESIEAEVEPVQLAFVLPLCGCTNVWFLPCSCTQSTPGDSGLCFLSLISSTGAGTPVHVVNHCCTLLNTVKYG